MIGVELEMFPRYLIGIDGNIFSLIYNKQLNPYFDKDGYMKVTPRDKFNLPKKMFIHRLVALAYIPNTNGYCMVNHKDGNKENNHASNLEWCNVSQNNYHAIITKLRMKSASKYYGVTYRRTQVGNKKWTARITMNKRRIHIGNFMTEIEAAKAYNDYCVSHGIYENKLNVLES